MATSHTAKSNLLSIFVTGLIWKQVVCLQDIYFGGFFSNNTSNGGWNSGGVFPAVEIALEEINNSTKLLNGYNLKLIPKDTMCESGYGTRQFIHLIQDRRKPIMLLGGGCSRSTEPIADTAQYWNLVQVGYSASSTALSNKKTYPLFIRTNQPEDSSNPAKILIMKHFGWSKVATLYTNEFVFSTTLDDLHQMMASENITRLASETFVGDTKYQITNIKKLDARIIVGTFYEEHAREAMCNAYLQGLFGNKYLWILPGWFRKHWWTEKDQSVSCTPAQIKAAAGNYITTAEIIEPENWNDILISGKKPKDVRDEYFKRINQSNYEYNAYYTCAYDATWALALTLNKSISILQAQGKSLENYTYQDNETAALFKRLLVKLSFKGMSGSVRFSENGDRIGEVRVGQLQGDEEVVLGYYDALRHTLVFNRDRSFYWLGGSPPRDRKMTEDTLASVHFVLFVCVAMLSSIGIILALVLLVFNIRYRDKRFMKMSSPRLNVLTIAGCIAVYTVVTLYGMDGSLLTRRQISIACQIQAWLSSIGFTLAYGALFAKTWRVHVIFTRRTERKVIKDGQLVGIVAGLLLIDVVILSSWQALDPLRAVPMYFSEVDDGGYTTTRKYIDICFCNEFRIWIGSICILKGLLLLFGAFLAWETRNITFAALNDSRNIAISVYTVTLSSIVGIPVVGFAKQYPNFTFALAAALVIICTTLTLSLIFVPKILALRNTENGRISVHPVPRRAVSGRSAVISPTT